MKNFFKRYLLVVLSILMVFSVVACGTNTRPINSTSTLSSKSQATSQQTSKDTTGVTTNTSNNTTSSALSSDNTSTLSSTKTSSATTTNSSKLNTSNVTSNVSKPSTSGGTSSGGQTVDVSAYLVKDSTVPFKIHYDEEAPFINEGSAEASMMSGHDIGWQNWSLPIGNGYVGANVFGRTDIERIQITEKTLSNPWQYVLNEGGTTSYPAIGGLNNFSETYLDFGHKADSATNYNRYLDLETAISGVNYTYNGVNYSREYFTSYPDKAIVIRLDASKTGQISFVLRPTIPFEQDYMKYEQDGFGKYGEVKSSVSNGVGHVELTGKMTYYDVDFVGLYDVYTDGGTIEATTCKNAKGETDGTITVSGANSAYVVITLGTDYELSSEIFATGQYDKNKPTAKTTLEDAKRKVEGYRTAVNGVMANKSFNDAYYALRDRHLEDYQALYGRVNLDINCSQTDIDLSTNDLLAKYQGGNSSSYLEALLLQYGRYLLIASSRKGTLPANLQGAWNCYNIPAWSSGYWNNINIQMNYWNAFSTNIAETFESYVDYLDAFIVKAKENATWQVGEYNPDVLGQDGGNGWTIGVASNPFFIGGDRSCGNMGFTTQVYWDYYQFTKDPQVLEKVYEIMVEAARYVTKCVKNYDGKYLVEYCDSPEMYVNGVWYYTTGTTYAQTLAYLNNYAVLEMAKDLGIDINNSSVLSQEEHSILKTILNQLDKYDPINVGLSGQIKEFREETYYGSMGNPLHRHISQLVGLFPGNLINSNTEAWLDAALVSVNGRNDGLEPFTWDKYDATEAYTVGWAWAHKAALYARAGQGDLAQEMLLGCTKGATLENLLMVCGKVFQIEASMGTSAAIAEMLLQSHDGYVAPLAAIPSNWQTGSYKGLVARGNFEVSAAWENGLATSFNILSKKGEKLSVKYPSITEAKVYTLDGKMVNFEIVGQDVISFDTMAGQTYVIYGFKKVETPNKVAKLEYERKALGEFSFGWEKVSGATSYNIYIAVENAAKYTLIGNTTNNGFKYTPNSEIANARMTFAITAVNASGRESGRTLCYYNPVDTTAEITNVDWSVLSTGQMQVIVHTNGNAGKYILWEMADGQTEYKVVAESIYPTIIGGTYKQTSKYAVSINSYYDNSSSDKWVIATKYNVNNILAGKEFIPTAEALSKVYSEKYGYPTLTDGINFSEFEGRYSSSKNGMVDATIDLKGCYILSEFRVYDFNGQTSNVGKTLQIDVLHNGVWKTIINCATNSEIDLHRVAGEGGTSWLAFNMGGAQAEKIRIYISATATTGGYITLYELECSGVLDETINGTYVNNIVLDKSFIPTTEAAGKVYDANTHGYPTLTDGVKYNESSGRFSSSQNGMLDATIELGGIYALTELRLYIYKNDLTMMGSSIVVQALSNGKWIEVANVLNADMSNYVVDDTSATFDYLALDLKYIQAEQIRLYIPNCTSSGWITFYEVECSGIYVGDAKVSSSNILAGKVFNPSASALASTLASYPYTALTDGVLYQESTGRYSCKSKGLMDGTINLNGVYNLSQVKFYLYKNSALDNAGTSIEIYTYYNGVWTKVIDVANASYSNYFVTNTEKAGYDFLVFNLGNVNAEKIRINIPGTTSTNYITFYEIEASGVYVGEATTTNINVLQGKNFVPTTEAENKVYSANYGYATLTDGVYGAESVGRFSSSENGMLDGIIDLKGQYLLSELKIHLYKDGVSKLGTKLTIQVYYNNEWTTIADITNEQMSALIVDNPNNTLYDFMIINLGNVKAEQIRISIPSCTDSKWITLYEIECSGVYLAEAEAKAVEILQGKLFVPTELAASKIYTGFEGMGYASLTDGVANQEINGRFSSDFNGMADATINLGGIYTLSELRFYVYKGQIASAGLDMLIEVYYKGKWIEVVNCANNQAINTYFVADSNTISGYGYLKFDLTGIKAEKIRFYQSGCVSGQTITYYEVECYGNLIATGIKEDKASNVVKNANATISGGTSSTLANALDGNFATALEATSTTGSYTITINLGTPINLFSLRIYENIKATNLVNGVIATASDNTKVEIYKDGYWLTIASGISLSADGYTYINLYGVQCSQIRVTFANTRTFDGQTDKACASIKEITCTSCNNASRQPIIDALKKFGFESMANYGYIFDSNYQEFVEYLKDTSATQQDIANYVENINNRAVA